MRRGGFLLAWALLNLWPLVTHPSAIPMPPVVQNTDFLVTHLPNALYIQTSLAQFHALPLWNAALFSGQPFAADPLSGYWYLPNWLTALQPQPWVFTLLFLAHLLWSGLGALRLLDSEGLRPMAALFGGAVWMATPKTIGYIAGGQVSIVYALAWTPWLVLAARRAARQADTRSALLAAACLALTFLADVRWAFYSGLLALAAGAASLPPNRQSALKGILAGAAALLAAGVLVAGQALPLLEFLGFTRRSTLGLEDLGSYPVSPASLPGLLLPQYGQIYELVIYLGWLPLVLAVFGLARQRWFWGASLAVSALFALGTNFVFFPLVARVLPGLSLLRVPSRAWFLVALCVSALAAHGLDRWLAGNLPALLKKWSLPVAAGASLLSALLALAAGPVLQLSPMPAGLVAALLLFPATFWLLTLAARACLAPRRLSLLCLGLAAADLLAFNLAQLTVYTPQTSPVVTWLESQPGLFRVYSPDGSLTLPNRLQMANGIDPLSLAAYAAYFGSAANLDLPGYSVSLPNIYIDSYTPPQVAAAAALPNAADLGLLNVRYLAAGFPLQSVGLKLEQTIGHTYIYENTLARPRAWLEQGQVEVTLWSPDRIQLSTNGPAGQLVLSEIVYPGWIASVDGQPASIEPYAGLLRSLQLGSGPHTVLFEFRPASVYLGGAIALAGWALLLGYFVWAARKHRGQSIQKEAPP